MTRITLSELKNATRNQGLRRSAVDAEQRFPTPMPVAASAVRRFHREGAVAATNALNRSFDASSYWGPTGTLQASGWANAIRAKFNTYVELASADSRPVFNTQVAADVPIGQHLVGVLIDVVLLDPMGYVGRHIIWDTQTLTHTNAERLAGPIILAMQQELGEDRVAGAEIWHLQSRAAFNIDRATALRRLEDIAAIVSTYLS